MAKRGFGEDAIYFDHVGDCRDVRLHRGCPGRWRGEVSLGFGGDGERIRRKVSGHTRQDVKDKLKALHADLDVGVRSSARYTVGDVIEDWRLAARLLAARCARRPSPG
jgi:integrase